MTDKLFEPFKIKNTTLQNRIMRSATWDATADEAGAVTDHSIAIYERLARGSIGLIVTGYAYVSSPLGKANPGQYGVYSDDLIPGWKRLAKAVHGGGDSKIAAQIVHAGINSGWLVEHGFTPLAVSKLPDFNRPHRELTDGEIEQIIEDVAAAAVRVREAGFDAVQLHGAHGYQMSQFASPLFNRRTDRWGGSAEKRRRFHLEVVRRARKAVGNDYPVLIKFGVQDDREGGMPFSEGLEICREMEKAGIDSIEISGGVGGGASLAIQEGEIDRPVFRERAAAVKKVVSVPVAVVHGVRSPELAKDIIDSGDADMVSFSRPFIREPGFVARWLKGDTRPAICISCNRCFPIVRRGEPLECGEERRIREGKTKT
ncbi:MAG: NADH:flavin oxidoreductase [Dehalococcoidia bacterium]|nr:NADH:flavin oxidoreductase [Dehalococcoidia bacterium]